MVVFGTPMHGPSIPFIAATILGTYCAAFDMRSCKLTSDLEGGAMNCFRIQKSTLAVDLISKQDTKDRKSLYFWVLYKHLLAKVGLHDTPI